MPSEPSEDTPKIKKLHMHEKKKKKNLHFHFRSLRNLHSFRRFLIQKTTVKRDAKILVKIND